MLPKPPLQPYQRIRNVSSHRNPYIDGLPHKPDCLPFKLQHALFTTIQTTAEEACFYFAQRWIPGLLVKMQWDTPEAGELNKWYDTLESEAVPVGALKIKTNSDLRTLFSRLNHVRHSAVHRLQTPTDAIKLMFRDAVELLICIGDDIRRNKLRIVELAVHAGDEKVIRQAIDRTLEECTNFDFDGTAPPVCEHLIAPSVQWFGNHSVQGSGLSRKEKRRGIRYEPYERPARAVKSMLEGSIGDHTRRSARLASINERRQNLRSNPRNWNGEMIDLTIDSDDEAKPITGTAYENTIDLTTDSDNDTPLNLKNKDISQTQLSQTQPEALTTKLEINTSQQEMAATTSSSRYFTSSVQAHKGPAMKAGNEYNNNKARTPSTTIPVVSATSATHTNVMMNRAMTEIIQTQDVKSQNDNGNRVEDVKSQNDNGNRVEAANNQNPLPGVSFLSPFGMISLD